MAPRRPRLLRALAASVVALVVLSGCSGGGGGTGGTSAGDKAGTSDAPSATESSTPPPPPQPRAGLARVGQCFQLSARQSRAAVPTGRRVRCRAPHTSVVAYAAVVQVALTTQTPLAKRRAVAARTCRPAFARVAGGTPADRATSLLTWVFFTPSAADLEKGARWVRCDVVARSGDVLVPLATQPPLLSGGIPEGLRICQNAKGIDVSCTRKHAFRVEAVYRETAPAYPAPRTYTPTARDRCKELMEGYGGYWQPPSRAGWARGDRFIRCLEQDPPPQ